MKPGPFVKLARHVRLSYGARSQVRPPPPPFLVLFINSGCNMRCDHCFYWDSLNEKTDLTLAEIKALSRDLGSIENLNLSGGEPFLRPEFAEVCAQFIHNNRARQIYCPTNGWYTGKTEAQLRRLMSERNLELFTIELSLDGMAEYHDQFRGRPGSLSRGFWKPTACWRNYRQASRGCRSTRSRPRLRKTSVRSFLLSRFLHERCPTMNRHNIALLRGERKRATMLGPPIAAYMEAAREVGRIWAGRKDRSGGQVVDPMLHWVKAETERRNTQAVACRGHSDGRGLRERRRLSLRAAPAVGEPAEETVSGDLALARGGGTPEAHLGEAVQLHQ